MEKRRVFFGEARLPESGSGTADDMGAERKRDIMGKNGLIPPLPAAPRPAGTFGNYVPNLGKRL